MAKFEITNPEAIKFINDFKSGALTAPYIEKIKKYRWYLISVCLFFLMIIFINIGKSIYRRSETPVFLPPKLENTSPKQASDSKSEFESIRQEIINFSTELPDPVIPPFDNNINLEPSELEVQL